MKTVITKKESGFNLICGFDEPSIDRYKTEEVVKPIFEALPEIQEIKNLHDKISYKKKEIRNAKNNLKNEQIKNDPKLEQKNRTAILEGEEFCRVTQRQAEELAKPLKKKKCDLMCSKAVYHEPKKGEYIITGEECAAICAVFEANKDDKNKKVVVDFDENGRPVNPRAVDDLRGKKYHVKNGGTWSEVEIQELGEVAPVGGKLLEELTQLEVDEMREQKETERISAMTAEEKQNEFSAMSQGLLSQAVYKRNELEILGVADALDQSQTFYNTELAKLKTKYGVA